MRLKTRLHALYEANSSDAHAFRYFLLTIDIVTILLLVATTFFYGSPWVFRVDLAIGIYVLADYAARL